MNEIRKVSPFSPPATSPSGNGAKRWAAVLSMTLSVFGLVTAEFLPATLLTPVSRDLGVTEGLAGQATTTTAAVAVITGLLVPTLTKRMDRRPLLLTFSLLAIASSLVVAAASGTGMLFTGRVFLGVALGGFWTMSTATVMRLVPERSVPKAVAVMYSGISAATILAVPLGSYAGNLVGWRSVFLIAAALSTSGLAAQFFTLPPLKARGHTRLRTLTDILKRPRLAPGMVSVILVFAGHFTFFPYIRPFLEGSVSTSINSISVILLGFGTASFVGTCLAGFTPERHVKLILIVPPLTMGILGLLFFAIRNGPVLYMSMVFLWGIAFGAIPGAWTTWAVRAAPDEAESASGLIVASIGIAQAIGAGTGGGFFDIWGLKSIFIASSGLSLAAVILILLARLWTSGSGRK